MAFKSKVQPKFTLDSPEALLHDLRAKKYKDHYLIKQICGEDIQVIHLIKQM